ncbi:MAG TPA: TadE/TadG family type IV pilus assembly protein [Candidatus Dormibacteraeota bacterium]|nr:TadE/TadG family type IV pilus assembly protein [Candidatus Dormibacteraeota bacterium]
MRTGFFRRHHGQSMIEFALLAPIFFLLLFGTIDLGRGIYIYNSISDAAREGTRAAVPFDSPLPTSATALAAVQSKLGGAIALSVDPCIANSSSPCPSTPTVPNTGTIWYSSGIGTPGRQPVTVKISYLFQPWVPIVREASGNGVVISAQSTMVTEY